MATKIYKEYMLQNSKFHEKNKLKSWKYFLKLILSKQNESDLKKIPKPNSTQVVANKENKFNMVESSVNHRPGIDNFVKRLSEYDIISFDIFDTAILRNVENPRDTFHILSSKLGMPNFKSIRNRAEEIAREQKYNQFNTREITLKDIYKVLDKNFNIPENIIDEEIKLEKDLCVANPYILEIYNKLKSLNKKVIFVSDMYLEKDILKEILDKNGYKNIDDIFVSNDLNLSKETGSMWYYLTHDYAKGKKFFHIGDNYKSDIQNAKSFGIETTMYHPVKELASLYREDFINNLGGSFYRAIINNNIHSGKWKASLRFEHGFRVGGILTYGYCEFIEQQARELNIDLILFCSRDCDIVNKVYTKYFDSVESKYIFVSRNALLNITLERNFEEYLSRIFNKNLEKTERDTIRKLFAKADFEFLIERFAKECFNPDSQICMANINKVKAFLYKYQNEIIEKNLQQVRAAKKYYSDICKAHKNILIVDVGWSGSSYSVLKYFLQKNINKKLNIYGSLLMGSNNDGVSVMSMDNTMRSYIISPIKNLDLLRYQFKKDKVQTNINCQVLEYLFTSTADSLLKYDLTKDGELNFVYNNRPHNDDVDVREIQRGILFFAEQFSKITKKYMSYFTISPYVASGAYFKTLSDYNYIKNIFGNFIYDATMGDYSNEKQLTFLEYLEPTTKIKKNENAKNILLVTHSFSVSGAPRSLLRIGKVLINAGYNVEVWSPFDGLVKQEYLDANISVKIIQARELNNPKIISQIKSFDMAICNTILTNVYYRKLKKYIPTAWYIREASNVPDYCTITTNSMMYNDLINATEIVCVSDYAKECLSLYNKNIYVVPNCVEDKENYSLQYVPVQDGKVKFVQLGSIEPRKGYHILLDAFENLPNKYKEKCELFFAGQIVKTNEEYANNILARTEKIKNVHYWGLISNEKEKIEKVSQMDAVIVASLDESCSLVALEATMLSKPLIVTENVGAKYVVDEKKNGLIVKTNDVEALKNAIIYLIDNQNNLSEMDLYSRNVYNKKANMKMYTENILKLVERYISDKNLVEKRNLFSIKSDRQKYKKAFKVASLEEKQNIVKISKNEYPKLYNKFEKDYKNELEKAEKMYQKQLVKKDKIIVSLTSYPPRMKHIHTCIKSLLNQYFKADEVVLWLAKEQFPNLEKDLPKELLSLTKKGLTIKWCDDLKPHKKYYYTMKENPNAVVITVDDDMKYSRLLIGKLYASYLKHPHCVSCLRSHLVTFNENGSIKNYKDWIFEDNTFVDKPTYRIVPTGVSGVLYPPHCLPKIAFDKKAIIENCLMTDDIWLKFMCSINGYPSVLVEKQGPIKCLSGTQDFAISLLNVSFGNDNNIKKCICFCDEKFGKNSIINKLNGKEDGLLGGY